MQLTPRDFLLHEGRRQIVSFEAARKVREADADEAGVAHYVQNVGEPHRLEVAPQPKAHRPLDVTVCRKSSPARPRAAAKEARKTRLFIEPSRHAIFPYRVFVQV